MKICLGNTTSAAQIKSWCLPTLLCDTNCVAAKTFFKKEFCKILTKVFESCLHLGSINCLGLKSIQMVETQQKKAFRPIEGTIVTKVEKELEHLKVNDLISLNQAIGVLATVQMLRSQGFQQICSVRLYILSAMTVFPRAYLILY